jgi:hypothetical protein
MMLSFFRQLALHHLLDVEDDVEPAPSKAGVLADAGEAAELVQHALDLDRGDRGALQRGEQSRSPASHERRSYCPNLQI